jgi:hypothetical protein
MAEPVTDGFGYIHTHDEATLAFVFEDEGQ